MPNKVAHIGGFIRAIADQTHPLQTKLSIILTDFLPNNNKQGIPKSEAENIIRTALHTPLKINFNGASYSGHMGAIPIGPITNVYYAEDNGRDVIAGDAVIWNDIYEDVADHLKVAFAEGIGTSWEVYFRESEQDTNGIDWLQECVFAGTCVVETPAYGPNRTRILAIAETLNDRAEILEYKIMANEVETQVSASAATDDVTTLRTDISSVMDVLGNIYTGLYTMLDDTYELEQNLVTDDMPGMAEQLNKLLASITKRFDSLKEKAGMAESAIAELTTLKESINAAEVAKAEEVKLSTRKQILSELGIELTTEKQEFYVTMSEDMFSRYVEDLRLVRGNKAASEQKKPIIPNPLNDNITVSVKDIAAAWGSNK